MVDNISCFACRLHELNLAWIRLPLEDVKPVISQLPRQLLRLNLSGCRENIDDSGKVLLHTV